MQSDQQRLRQNTRIPLADQVGSGPSGYTPNVDFPAFFGQNVDFQPSKICPRNFVIFDRTDNRSQIMYHPAVTSGFGYPGLNVQDNIVVRNDVNAPTEVRSVMKEDSADIDFLLSYEEDEHEQEQEHEYEYEYEYEEDELSTARTNGNDTATDTADSCSSRSSKNSRLGLSSFSHKSSGSNEKKRQKMRKMVNSLRGIVPGGNRMNTVAVLDEAVKYLKSLKVELQKVGVGNLKN